MNREIERKFLTNELVGIPLQESQHRIHIVQGYLSKDSERIVRIRHVTESPDRDTFASYGVITIKTKKKEDTDAGVNELEYAISSDDATILLDSCHQPLIEKVRHIHRQNGHKWEIDVFEGHKRGLILAEIEVANINEFVNLPEWIGEEVTGRPEYSNSNM